MKRVLVTGAAGFIGRQSLAPLVARGYEVHAVTEDRPLAEPAGVRWHQADLMAPARVAGLLADVRPSHLLHFAWFARPGEYWTSLENVRWVQASLELFQAFARQGGERVVGAGTCAEYDWGHGRCRERETPLGGSLLYGTCKRAVHLVLEAFADRTGLSAAWGRIFFLYGPHEDRRRLVPSVILSLLGGRPALCTHGRHVRDLLHVADVGDAFAALLDAAVTGPVNVASGQPVALKDVIEKIAALLGRPDLVKLGAIAPADHEPPLLVADVRRLADEVGWTPRYDLDAGLRHTVEWWKAEGAREGG